MSHAPVLPTEAPARIEWPEGCKAEVAEALGRYPNPRSAVLPVLWIAQHHWGWVSPSALKLVAETVGIPEPEVFGIATFYTMFNLKPVGKHHIQVCRTTPCWLRGADDLTAACKQKLGIGLKERTADGLFSLVEVECLGACVNAPVIQINDDFYEDLDPARLEAVLDALARGQTPAIGSQIGRQGGAPVGGPLTLHTEAGE